MRKIKSGFARQGRKLGKPPDKSLSAISMIILIWLVIFCVGPSLSDRTHSMDVPVTKSGNQNRILDNCPATQHDTTYDRSSKQPTSLLQQTISACEGESIHEAPQIINKRSRENALNSNSTVNKLSDFASSKRWTTSSGIFAHNLSNLDFGFNQSFAESNNISKLTGSKGWTSSSGFFAYKNSNMLSRIQPRNYNLSKYRHSVTSLRGRVLLLTSPSFFALYNCNLHPADHRAPSITGDHLVELPAIFDNSDEISNQNKNKLSKIKERNYSLPSRHSITCLRGRVHALCSSLTFKVLLLKCPSTKRINQRSNPSSRSNLSVLQMKNDIILQLYSVSESFNIKRSTLQRSATNMISLFLIPEHEITTKLFLTNDLQSNKRSKSPAFRLIVESCFALRDHERDFKNARVTAIYSTSSQQYQQRHQLRTILCELEAQITEMAPTSSAVLSKVKPPSILQIVNWNIATRLIVEFNEGKEALPKPHIVSDEDLNKTSTNRIIVKSSKESLLLNRRRRHVFAFTHWPSVKLNLFIPNKRCQPHKKSTSFVTPCFVDLHPPLSPSLLDSQFACIALKCGARCVHLRKGYNVLPAIYSTCHRASRRISFVA